VYYEEGIKESNIPRGCKEFKEDALENNNVVAEFVKEYLEKTDDASGFVKASDLFSYFTAEYRDYQRDKLTKLGKKQFQELVLPILGNSCFFEMTRVGGVKVRSVFVGWKLKQDNNEADI